MQNLYSIWFHDYDAKPSLLYRSAMRLRQESWDFVDDINTARWWVICQPSEETERKIKTLYQQQKHRPVVVVLSDDKTSEYHKSWAVLRMPINYVTFFKWIDEVVDNMQTGVLDTDSNALYKLAVDDEQLFHNERWTQADFKLSKWPNVARFDNGVAIVELCSLLLESFQSLSSLKNRGFDTQLTYDLLSVCDTRGILVYNQESAILASTSVVNTESVAESVGIDSEESVTSVTPVETTQKKHPIVFDDTDAVVQNSEQVVLSEVDEYESRVASGNKPSLLDAILKTLKLK